MRELGLALGLVASAIVGTPATAEPVPMPQTDYAAKGRFAGGGEISVRHRAGKMRLDFTVAGAPVTMTGIVDLGSRKVLMTMPIPGAKTALEIDLADGGSFGQAVGEGRRTGSATVAGERCDTWEIDGKGAGKAVACVTADGIHLRTEVENDGKRQTVMEIGGLTRGPQDPKLFELPPGTQITKAPAGMNVLPGGPAR